MTLQKLTDLWYETLHIPYILLISQPQNSVKVRGLDITKGVRCCFWEIQIIYFLID